MSDAAFSAEKRGGPLAGEARPARLGRRAPIPFFGVLDSVLVDLPAPLEFPGAIRRPHADAAWNWVRREMLPYLDGAIGSAGSFSPGSAADNNLAQIVERMRAALPPPEDYDAERRLQAQLGGEEALAGLPALIAALKARTLISSAAALGRAINNLPDEDAIAPVLQAIPKGPAAPLMMQAAVGEVANPVRLVVAAIRLAGTPTEAGIVHAGYGALVDAILSHAQNEVPKLGEAGVFADGDLACRAIERYNRLVRAVSAYMELGRQGRWTRALSTIATAMSERIEPSLREIVPNVARALRSRSESSDQIDPGVMLAALNGMYLLATVRDCRPSLALNTLFDQVWTQVGQMLELLLTRALDTLRRDPGNEAARARLETGITMAEIRFNADYANVLRRAKDVAERKIGAV